MVRARHFLLLAALAWATSSGGAQQPEDSCPPEDSCRPGASEPVCSGRGTCECGACACDVRPNPSERYSGVFCECDNFSCSRRDGQLCGGSSRGQCVCGLCRCAPGWTGEACGCSTDTDTCVQPGSDRVCSGRGTCVCGQCSCSSHAGEAYSGRFCQTCPTCAGSCVTLKPCVECRAFNAGPHKDNCDAQCGSVRQLKRVTNLTVADASEQLCHFVTADGCRYRFVATAVGAVRVAAELQCPPGVSHGWPSPQRAAGTAAAPVTLATASAVLFACLLR
ncbi:integrin beta-PS-like [Pollicipes pollicipes]|uniref:integrin beta-PS-like n=1 Tax=Pollicipes pollicipes TaxID=41117 RepID=UPI001884D86B|nr:integrin beta-PS-like [Pollicipes pollicipes]